MNLNFSGGRRLLYTSCLLIAGTIAGACAAQAEYDASGSDSARATTGSVAPSGAVAESASEAPAARTSEGGVASAASPGAEAASRPVAQPSAPAAGGSAAGDSSGAAASRDSPVTPSGSLNVSVPEGRSRRDSLALVRAVRSGMNVESWPSSPSSGRADAILPGRRIVAYYGNPLSRRMGALGEYPVDEMLERLDREVQAWREADPDTPVQPALHLVAVVAQADGGRDGKYRARMADTLVERVYEWAQRAGAIMFLDIQVGLASIEEELPRLEKFLSRPDVHLGIDPEFSMKTGARPGTRIGTFDAADINHTSRFLAEIVERYDLPPKVLVVHRFTQSMVTNATDIRRDPRVQVVMHMDGWGAPWLKFDSYREFILREPVEFTGFKIFYKNDTRTGTSVLTPMELVQLVPAPVYVQYQ
jgi:hypothetical protein